MANFCTNCGNKLRKEDNFCTNCGTKIDKSDMKENTPLLKSVIDDMGKKKAKEKEKEPKKAKIKKEIIPKKIDENKMTHGGYCGLNCRHCYEEFFDSGGGLTGDFDSEGYTEYYCHLGHNLSFGSFCEDYKK